MITFINKLLYTFFVRFVNLQHKIDVTFNNISGGQSVLGRLQLTKSERHISVNYSDVFQYYLNSLSILVIELLIFY